MTSSFALLRMSLGIPEMERFNEMIYRKHALEFLHGGNEVCWPSANLNSRHDTRERGKQTRLTHICARTVTIVAVHTQKHKNKQGGHEMSETRINVGL